MHAVKVVSCTGDGDLLDLVAALFNDRYGDRPQAAVEEFLLRNASAGRIRGLAGQTPNRLLFKPATL